MKRVAATLALLSMMPSLPAAYADTPTYRTETHSKTCSMARRSSASRPYCGGGKHTTSHGGRYPGTTNAHHRNGHYQNWRTANRYGVHKPS